MSFPGPDWTDRCIFCRGPGPFSKEHVFPEAVGGVSTIGRICVPCNSWLGSNVDPLLTDNPAVLSRRWALKLRGKKGSVPDPLARILGSGRLADFPAHRVKVKIDPATNKPDIEMLYTTTLDDNGNSVVSIDFRNKAEIPKILQRLRINNGLPPFSLEDLRKQYNIILENGPIETLNPWVVHDVNVKLFDRALLKIAYELAFKWLGDIYLNDPTAQRIRWSLLQDIPFKDIVIACPPDHGRYWIWEEDTNTHIAFASRESQFLTVNIRIFDVISASVIVSANAGDDYDWPRGSRFIANEPILKSVREGTFWEEVGRFTRSIIDDELKVAKVIARFAQPRNPSDL